MDQAARTGAKPSRRAKPALRCQRQAPRSRVRRRPTTEGSAAILRDRLSVWLVAIERGLSKTPADRRPAKLLALWTDRLRAYEALCRLAPEPRDRTN